MIVLTFFVVLIFGRDNSLKLSRSFTELLHYVPDEEPGTTDAAAAAPANGVGG
jgi:hypothetical protein